MSEYALRLANGADTAPRVRAGDALGLTPNGAVRARAGFRPDGGGVVAVTAGTMNVTVTPFSCWVDASPAGQVGYPFVCDATKTLAIDPGDATLSRTDVVAVVVRENAYDGGGVTSATLQVVKGTPGAGTPSLPAAALPLRNIVVPAGTSAGGGGLSSGMLSTDRRVYTVALGGVLPVTADPTSPYVGQVIYRTDVKAFKVWNGTKWDTYGHDLEQAGTVTVSTGGGGTGVATVTFATPFDAAPIVSATSGDTNYFASVSSVTATGFQARITHYNATPVAYSAAVTWFARPATQ